AVPVGPLHHRRDAEAVGHNHSLPDLGGAKACLLRWRRICDKHDRHQSMRLGQDCHWRNRPTCFIYLPERWKAFAMTPGNRPPLMTANEAASVTGVPLRQVHRIIDAGLLDGAVKRRRNNRLLPRNALIGLKLAHDTAAVLTLEARRAVIASLI